MGAQTLRLGRRSWWGLKFHNEVSVPEVEAPKLPEVPRRGC